MKYKLVASNTLELVTGSLDWAPDYATYLAPLHWIVTVKSSVAPV